MRSKDAKRPRTAIPRAALLAGGVGVAVLVLLSLPDLGRLFDFADFRALHPDRANEGGLGNLPGQISPLEALGIWPTSEFRLSAAASSLPAALFYLGGAFALVCLALALPRWIRRHGAAIPAALVAAAVLYLLARGLGTVYTSAKALSIAAPLIALITLGGLLAASPRALRALGIVFGVAVAFCSFLILRQAPVAPSDHADELAEIRPLVEGEKLLFLGRDNFVLYELRGSKPFTHVRNFYDPYFVEPNFDLANVGSKFDFDSVTAKTLARFPYVLTTRAEYASGPPPGYRAVKTTNDYVLWHRGRSPLGREPGEDDAAPGRTGGCPAGRPAAVSSFLTPPVPADEDAWSQTTVESGQSATVELDLPRGAWNLSLQYDSTRPVTLSADGRLGHPARQPRLPWRGAVLGGPRADARGARPGDGDGDGRGAAARRAADGRPLGRASRRDRGDPGRPGDDRLQRLRRLVRALMDLSFGEAMLIFGALLAVTAALSGITRGTVLSTSVLSIALGILLAELDLVSVDVGDAGVVELIELALILTLVSDGLLVDRELLGRHWGPPARALVFALPITLLLLALGAKLLFTELSWAEAFLLGAVLCATDPVVTSSVVTSRHVPERVRHTLNLESGLNDGLALPFVLFFLVLASPGGDAGGEAAELVGEAAFGAVIGVALGVLGGWLHRVVPHGVTGRYEGIYAIGFGLAAFGLADITFGNGLIAAFVFGITLGFSEHEITESFSDFAENLSAIFQVFTFFVFGALIVTTGFEGEVAALAAFIVFALAIARPVAVRLALIGTDLPGPQKAFIAWFGPKGVASMLFALLVLDAAGRPPDARLRRRLVRDPRLDRRPRADRYRRRPMDRSQDGYAGERPDRPGADRGVAAAAGRDRRGGRRRRAGDARQPDGGGGVRPRPRPLLAPPAPVLHPAIRAGAQPAPAGRAARRADRRLDQRPRGRCLPGGAARQAQPRAGAVPRRAADGLPGGPLAQQLGAPRPRPPARPLRAVRGRARAPGPGDRQRRPARVHPAPRRGGRGLIPGDREAGERRALQPLRLRGDRRGRGARDPELVHVARGGGGRPGAAGPARLAVGELLDDLARGLGVDVGELQIEADRVLEVAEQGGLLDLGRRLRGAVGQSSLTPAPPRGARRPTRSRRCGGSCPSSFGSNPSARPTSCGRCRTARPRSRLTTFAASGCCRSRLRWQSGHGVTRQSAPWSRASAMWVPAWRSEVSRFIVITGKPQHLRAPSYSTTSPPSASITCSR